MKKKNRKNQFLALTLALSLGIMPVDSSVFAASDFISDTAGQQYNRQHSGF